MACPSGSIRYNTSLCACAPGRLLNVSANACTLFTANTTINVDSGVDYYAVSFPETIFSFDSIKRFTQSQALFLEATAILLLSWLAFCVFLRFMKVGDGRNAWFQIRWWISRLDVCFSTRHWLEDQKVVKKRKTELGGTLSIASWILFTGLFAALLYQIIWKRTIEIHNVRATNGPDLATFNNDMEFNITTVSSMSCSNLRSTHTVVLGSPGLVDYRVAALSSFADFSCHNTSEGPTVRLRCSNCQLSQDNYYISWQFVDLPNNPATAVGFRFNLTSNAHGSEKHVSFVSGTLKNGSADDGPVTFRGNATNLLKFNLFPRIYHNIHDLRLIQPLFHEFLPGSVFQDASQLQASLESSNGIINTTFYVNFLSAYVVEIDNQSIMGPVSFLADLGGLYCISIGIFYYFLVQCEYRVKRLRNEDAVLRQIRHRLKAQERWDRLRKYVTYTWGCKALEENYTNGTTEPHCSNCMLHSVRRSGSLHTSRSLGKLSQRKETINHSKKLSLPSKKNATPECPQLQEVRTHLAGAGNQDRMPESRCDTPPKHELCSAADKKQQQSIELQEKSISSASVLSLTDDRLIPPLPALELKAGSDMDMTDVQKNIKLLYEYNAMLREKLVATHSMLRDLVTEPSSAMSRDKR